LFTRSSGLVDQTFFQWATGNAVNASSSGAASRSVAQHRLDLGELAAEHPGNHLELLVDVLGVRLGEDGADGGGDHLGRAFGDLAQDVAQEVDPAPLDARAGQDRLDGRSQPEVGVGDHQLHSGKPAGLEAAQERRPEGAVLAVTHREAEDLAAPVGARRCTPRWRPRRPG
jgi:hypothetical protein